MSWEVFTIKLEGGDMTQCGEVILAHGLTVPRQGQQMIDSCLHFAKRPSKKRASFLDASFKLMRDCY